MWTQLVKSSICSKQINSYSDPKWRPFEDSKWIMNFFESSIATTLSRNLAFWSQESDMWPLGLTWLPANPAKIHPLAWKIYLLLLSNDMAPKNYPVSGIRTVVIFYFFFYLLWNDVQLQPKLLDWLEFWRAVF